MQFASYSQSQSKERTSKLNKLLEKLKIETIPDITTQSVLQTYQQNATSMSYPYSPYYTYPMQTISQPYIPPVVQSIQTISSPNSPINRSSTENKEESKEESKEIAIGIENKLTYV